MAQMQHTTTNPKIATGNPHSRTNFDHENFSTFEISERLSAVPFSVFTFFSSVGLIESHHT
jgi:hypothetical protein